MLLQECKVGLKVFFGRANGEKTLGEVTKLNPTKAKVKILENRGSRSEAGTIWSVPYSMMTLADENAKSSVSNFGSSPEIDYELKFNPFDREDNLILEAIVSVYSCLSPENLTCDGELSRSAVQQRYTEYNRKLKYLQQALGRNVSEGQAYNWLTEKEKYEKERLERMKLCPV